jgi:hypothetical protein
MKRFASIDWLDNAILYTLELIASLSVLFLAVGLIASVANVLTQGSILTNNEVGKQFYAWSQAIGIDASIPGVIIRLFTYCKGREWGKATVYTILSLLVLFTAFNVSNIEAIQQTLNLTLDEGYTHSLISVEALVNIRSLTVILLIVSHALRHVHQEAPIAVKPVKAKAVQVAPVAPVQTAPSVQPVAPKAPTPINTNFDRVKAYLADHPNASAREVGRALGMSPPTAAKWVKKVRAA